MYQLLEALAQFRNLVEIVLDCAENLFEPRRPKRFLIFREQCVIAGIGFMVDFFNIRPCRMQGFPQFPGLGSQGRRRNETSIRENNDGRSFFAFQWANGFDGFAGDGFQVVSRPGKRFMKATFSILVFHLSSGVIAGSSPVTVTA